MEPHRVLERAASDIAPRRPRKIISLKAASMPDAAIERAQAGGNGGAGEAAQGSVATGFGVGAKWYHATILLKPRH
jgi:hypothetical protein